MLQSLNRKAIARWINPSRFRSIEPPEDSRVVRPCSRSLTFSCTGDGRLAWRMNCPMLAVSRCREARDAEMCRQELLLPGRLFEDYELMTANIGQNLLAAMRGRKPSLRSTE